MRDSLDDALLSQYNSTFYTNNSSQMQDPHLPYQ